MMMSCGVYCTGVFNVVTGQGSFGQMIATHPGVDKIGFTGSTQVSIYPVKPVRYTLSNQLDIQYPVKPVRYTYSYTSRSLYTSLPRSHCYMLYVCII